MSLPIEFIPLDTIKTVSTNLLNISFLENLDLDSFDVLEVYYAIEPKYGKEFHDPSVRIKKIKMFHKYFNTESNTLTTLDIIPCLEAFYILYNKLVVVYTSASNFYKLAKQCSQNMIVVRKL